MKSTRTLLAVLCALATVPLMSQAALVTGTWNFSATAAGTTYSGSFSFTDLDTDLTYVDSTDAGFLVTTNFDTTGNGGNAFRYGGGNLRIGGLMGSVDSASGSSNDWILFTPDFSTGQFAYYGAAARVSTVELAVTPVPQVPEPTSLALLAAALLAGVLARQRNS